MRYEEQIEVLDRAFETMRDIRIGGRKQASYAPFQKGWLIRLTSLKEMFLELKHDYSTDFLLTARLNQDHLENFFSQLRGVGGFNMNPTALEVKHRMKKLICSNTILVPETASVRQDSEDVGMIGSQLFSKLISAEQQTIEHLSTRNTFTEILLEEAVDRLTSIDWSIHPINLQMEDFSRHDRSELGGIEYVAGFIAKELLEKHPLLSRVRSQEEPGNFWVAFLSQGMDGGGLVEPSTL
jgi:hypothetical protein